MRVTVHQPNYAPWSGYFAKMFVSDVFVLFDYVQLPQGHSYVPPPRTSGFYVLAADTGRVPPSTISVW
jgi:WbqC-like protein family